MASYILKHKVNLIALAVLAVFIAANFYVYDINIRTITFAVALVICASWELYKPAFPVKDSQNKSERWAINFTLSLMVAFVSSFPAFIVSVYAYYGELGLFNTFKIPLFIEIALAVIVLDLVFYALHVFVHMNPLFWKSHRIHHSDIVYDVSIVARDHFITALLLSLGRCAIVLIFGFSPLGYGMYLVILSVTLPFIHSNIYLPTWLDKIVRLVFVTPNMHYVHHSSWYKETNSNYGVMFSWWDKIFGTYKEAPKNGHENMEVGLKEWRKQSELTLTKLLLMPFREK